MPCLILPSEKRFWSIADTLSSENIRRYFGGQPPPDVVSFNSLVYQAFEALGW